MAERQTGNQFKQLRIDGAGELTSHAFVQFCQQKGIIKQVTVPDSSQMNGVAEQKHQLLQFQARTMLLHARLSTTYWAEAVATATYLVNRLPSKSVGGQIPYTLWTGRKPTLKHVRVFGSPAYVYAPATRGQKFAARSESMFSWVTWRS